MIASSELLHQKVRSDHSSQFLYAVSKHGVVTLSEKLALELAARGARLKVSVLCPEWVNTRILDAQRNRPQALQNAPGEQQMSPEMAAAVQQFLRQLVQTGLAPSQVAEIVFGAIRQEKFYILTQSIVRRVPRQPAHLHLEASYSVY
jgi:NAD(P)-dependent dehydrogenase (short-subunit alcohol dehydrogenase family)